MNGNEAAYPCPVGHIECAHPTGLTKRELFAAMAMQGLLANPDPQRLQIDSAMRAEWSVNIADALLAELAKANP